MSTQTTKMRVALAQVNATVGDIAGNAALVAEWTARARDQGAQLVVFPELVLSGYPAEDLFLKPHFLRACRSALDELASDTTGVVSLVGFPQQDAGVRNSVAVLGDGEVRGIYQKVLLPNYGVFDERRYFEPGPGPALMELNGVRIGLTTCEDIWFPGPPASLEAMAGATLIVNPSASPYHRGKGTFARRWSPIAPARQAPRSLSATRSAVRTSSSSTVTALSSPVPATPWRALANSRRTS